MNNFCFNTHRILDDADIVANNVEPDMHADIDAENVHTPESILTFSATKSKAVFNICTIFAVRLFYS